MILELKEYDHPYYCSESNYYSNECYAHYECWADYLEDYDEATDVDMNLIFRWDIKPHYDYDEESHEIETGKFELYIFRIKQRKGIFECQEIIITSEDIPAIEAYLKPYYETIKQLWRPFE